MKRPRMEASAAVLGALDAGKLARFYERLLGWEIAVDQGDWVMLRHPNGGTGLSFQSEPDHIRPTWPAQPGEQQMMVHLDIGVDNLECGLAWAVDAGAVLAEFQPQEDVRVMLDPSGHPFCLFEAPFDDA